MGIQMCRDRYEIPCGGASDPELQRFNAGLRLRTSKVLGSIAKGVDENRSMSFQSLKDVTCGLLDMDQEVLRIILESKADVWANKELLRLVEEYFEISLKTLDFCVALEKAAKTARDEQLVVQAALAGLATDGHHESNMEELRAFRSAGSAFGERIAAQFQSVYASHIEMQSRLRSQKKKLDKKLRYVKGWIKVSSAILATTCAALLICSVVAAVIAAPPIASAAAAVSSLPLEAAGRWFKSLGRRSEQKIRARRDVVQDMYLGTFLMLRDLDTVRVLVDRLEGEMDRMVRSVEFGERHPSTVGLVVEQIRGQQAEFMADLDDFQKHVDMCSKTICRARTVVLQKIIHHPSPAEAPSSSSLH